MNENLEEACNRCGKTDVKLSRCGGCKRALYCSRDCQKRDWKDSHKLVCKTIKAQQKNLKQAVKSGETYTDEFTWKPFLPRATLKNILTLDVVDESPWELRLDAEHNLLIVVDLCSPFKDYEEALIGKGPMPDSTDDLIKVLFACMMFPSEDHIPRRPKSILLTQPVLAKGVDYKYLWSEMLRIGMAVWRKDNPQDEEMQMSLRCFPIKRLGTYAKGETFYEPQLKLRIEWLSDEKRNERFNQLGYFKSVEECIHNELNLSWDIEKKLPRWEWAGYDSHEECLADFGEEEKEHMSKVVYEWQEENENRTVEDICMDEYGAKTPEECAWDYYGVPRLTTEDENADKILLAAGFECQGYKPGKFFVLDENSVKLGRRLIEYQGFFYEEKRRTKETREELFAACMHEMYGR